MLLKYFNMEIKNPLQGKANVCSGANLMGRHFNLKSCVILRSVPQLLSCFSSTTKCNLFLVLDFAQQKLMPDGHCSI